jgi:hypothetical protein
MHQQQRDVWWRLCGACRFEGQEGDAILLLSRQQFVPEQLQGLLSSCCHVTTDFENDIYSKVRRSAWHLALVSTSIYCLFELMERSSVPTPSRGGHPTAIGHLYRADVM